MMARAVGLYLLGRTLAILLFKNTFTEVVEYT